MASDCRSSQVLTLHRWTDGWESRDWDSSYLHKELETLQEWLSSSQITIWRLSATRARRCEGCRKSCCTLLGLSDEWWSDNLKTSNGYFGCSMDENERTVTNSTWARFQTKYLVSSESYEWQHLNIFTNQEKSSQKTAIGVFDVQTSIANQLIDALSKVNPCQFSDPLWMYPDVAKELVNLQTKSVWAMRNHIRAVEQAPGRITREAFHQRRNINFRDLHDLSRHAVHISGTLDVSLQSLKAIVERHPDISTTDATSTRLSIQMRLLSYHQMLQSLSYRSRSNYDRLQNEIQLAFNQVAQDDSGTSLRIANSSRHDSAAMKAIAFVTLVFLPPTFVCAVFSTSFFTFDKDMGWARSSDFWILWAVSLPLTAVSGILCHVWLKAVQRTM